MDPEIRYAKTRDGVHLAFQARGDGPELVELSHGTLFSIDSTDEQPRWSRFEARLASFSRLIRFDMRGIGLSDPIRSGDDTPSVEQWMTDALAVMDAAGCKRGALYAAGFGGLVGLVLAVTHPERVTALVLVNAFPRILRAPDYPPGVPEHLFDVFGGALVDPDARAPADDLALMAPSLLDDRNLRSWWERAGHRGASPAAAAAQWAAVRGTDVRDVLPTISVPTLVLQNVDNGYVRADHGRYLAEHIAGARLVELPGADHVPWAANADEIAGEMEEFLTGRRGASEPERVLATVLFTDIVGSTRRASELGDDAWRELLDRHDDVVRRLLERFHGREVKTVGDGFLATFDGPARAVRCACAIRDGVHQLGLEVRSGLHTGEIELRGDDIGGIGVHIAQRISALASGGEVLVSRTVTDLVAGSGITFADRGDHELKGVPGSWHLAAVR